MIYKDKGIVIKSKEYIGADKIITLLSPDKGIEYFILKGVIKSKSKKLNSSEIGAFIKLNYYKKHSDAPSFASEVKIVNSFPGIKNNYKKTLLLNYIMELFLLLYNKEDSKQLFNFLYNILIEMSKVKEITNTFLRYIEYRLIQINGIFPDIRRCEICGQDIYKNFYYNKINNQIKCSNCSNQNDIKIDSSFLNQLNENNIKTINNIKIGKENNNTIFQFFYGIILNYTHKEIKSYKIIHQILKTGDGALLY